MIAPPTLESVPVCSAVVTTRLSHFLKLSCLAGSAELKSPFGINPCTSSFHPVSPDPRFSPSPPSGPWEACLCRQPLQALHIRSEEISRRTGLFQGAVFAHSGMMPPTAKPRTLLQAALLPASLHLQSHCASLQLSAG